MITSIWSVPGEDATDARILRQAVFVEELGLDSSLVWDTSDLYAYHLILLLDGVPAATGRIAYGGIGIAKLERICVKKACRRQGIGDGLVKILDYQAFQLGMTYSQTDAAEELQPFFRRIGFAPCGEPFSCWNCFLTPMRKPVSHRTFCTCE